MTIYVGIDPGLTGAIAFIDATAGRVVIEDIPTKDTGGKGLVSRRVDGLELVQLVRRNCPPGASVAVGCEAVTAMGGQDNALQTQGSLMRTLGSIEAVFDALRWPCWMVAPQVWQGMFGLIGKKNEKRERGQMPAAIVRACTLYPHAAAQLARVKDHNRAEALLIAHYTRSRLE